MYYLVSYSEEDLEIKIHASSEFKEKCHKVLKKLLVEWIQSEFGQDEETANVIYEKANNASAEEEDEVISEYGIDIHVSEYGASTDDGAHMMMYKIIDYVPDPQ